MTRTPRAVAALALLGTVGYLLATGSLAIGAANSHGTVSLRSTSLGKVLVSSTGRTLYLFEKDKNGKSSCAGQCAKYWPPLIAKVKPTAGAGISAAKLGRVRRADGRMQVTYNHHPLYLFLLDKAAGQTKGQSQDFFGGKWYVVSARGTAIVKQAGTTTATTTTAETTTTSGYQPPKYP
jgi:predicted lipoprotein with Yx(FWY)xxD motif